MGVPRLASCLAGLAALPLLTTLAGAGAAPPDAFSAPVAAGGTSYTASFVRLDHRSPSFNVQLESGGVLTPLTPDPDHHATYVGTLDGEPGAFAGATYFTATGDVYYHVVFADGEEWINEGGTTTVLGGGLGTSWAQLVPGPGGAGGALWAAEVGVDLPNDRYVNNHASDPADALAMIEHSFMATNLIYMSQLGIQHRLGRVVIRGDAGSDPYAPLTSHGQYLDEVVNQWNHVLPPSTHDLALVVRAQAGAGLAYVGVVGNPGYSSNDASPRGDFSRVWRHEVGHNWFLGHYDGGAPEGPTINSGNAIARMSGPEQALVTYHRDDRLGALDDLGVMSLPVPPRASTDRALVSAQLGTVVLDVLANDHDVNGDDVTILSIDAVSELSLGGSMAIEPGGGAAGRDGVRYTLPALGGATSAIDRFRYRIVDASGLEAEGYVYARVVDFDPAGIYEQDFDAYADGTTDLDDGSYICNVGEGSNARVVGGALELTPDQLWRQSSWTLPTLSLEDGHTTTFRYRITASGSPADGFAFNLGAPNATRLPVNGIGDFPHGLTVEWNTYASRGHQVRVDGVQVPGGYDQDFDLADGIWHDARVAWYPGQGLTLTVDGVPIFDALATPGFAPTPDDMLAFSGYTGGLSQQVLIDDVHVTRGVVVAAGEAGAPLRFALGASVPNPFNPRTTLRFELPSSAEVELVVFDAKGRLVRRLVDGATYPAGRHGVVWQGEDDAGRSVASGVYFYRLTAGAFEAARRTTLLR